jgi:hypothetical protein
MTTRTLVEITKAASAAWETALAQYEKTRSRADRVKLEKAKTEARRMLKLHALAMKDGQR